MIETSDGGPILLHSYVHPVTVPTKEHSRAPTENGSVRRKDVVAAAREGLRLLSSEEGTSAGERELTNGEGKTRAVNGNWSPLRSNEDQSDEDEEEEEDRGEEEDDEEEDEEDADDEASLKLPPLLIATVVTPSAAEALDARRAAARLERMGREFQSAWMREQEDARGGGDD